MVLSIIIPLFNEESLIGKVVEKVCQVDFNGLCEQMELIIVDDASSDNSFIEAQKAIEAKQNCKLLRHDTNQGKGAAILTGIKACSGDVFLFQDSDLELSPSDIPEMLRTMKFLNIGFVNGSRYLPGISRPLSSYKRYLANRLFTFMTSVLINVKLTDMACGYKLITRELFEKITIREKRFAFEAELIIKALRVKKNNVAEIPVHYFPRNEGDGKKFRSVDGIRILWAITKYGLFHSK